MKIDAKDKKIINVLIDNCRLSYRQIAKKCKLNVVTVINRVRKLEEEGVIKKYSVSLDYNKLGYDFPVIVDARVLKGEEVEIGERIFNLPNICSVYDVTGDFDLSILARFKTRKGLDEFIKSLPKREFIVRTNTRLIINTIKEGNLKV
jgi:DNA-binding Lrp family transcriptional regulator